MFHCLSGSQTSRGSGDSLKPTSEDTGRLLYSLGPTPAPSRDGRPWTVYDRLRFRHSALGAVWEVFSRVSTPQAVTIITAQVFWLFFFFTEMSSLKTRGRKLKRVAAALHVGGRVVGPKPSASSDGQNPTARQFPSHCIPLTLIQRHGPTCGVAGVASSHVLDVWGRLCPTLPEGATPFLGGRPSAGTESGVM